MSIIAHFTHRAFVVTSSSLVVLAVLLCFSSESYAAVVGCEVEPGSCNAPIASCSSTPTSGTDNCGYTCSNTFFKGSCVKNDPTLTCGGFWAPGHYSNCPASFCSVWVSSCAGGGGGCTSVAGSCTAPTATCAMSYTTGTNSCGSFCSDSFYKGSCVKDGYVACGSFGPGHYSICTSKTCTAFGVFCGACIADGSLACNKTGPGHRANDKLVSCTATGNCNFVPYGFALPEDPSAGYVFDYDDNNDKDMLGIVAKGNIIIGDYTHPIFQAQVIPMIQPNKPSNLAGKTQPYEIDPSDANIGYANDICFGTSDCFDGNYDQQDKELDISKTLVLAYKKYIDGSVALDASGKPIPRKFFESSLEDMQFKALVDNYLNDGGSGTTKNGRLDAVLFTNHLLASSVRLKVFTINGAVIARDEAMRYREDFNIHHDVRLDGDMGGRIFLPVTVGRPQLVSWQECPASGCP